MPYEKTDADIRFGRLLKEARDRAGLSSETIAKQLYVERRTVDRWMIGDRRPLTESLVAEYERVCGLESGALVTAYRALPPRGQAPAGSSENVPPGPLGGAAVHPDGGGGDAGPPPSSESGAVVKSLAKRRATRSLPRWATLVVAMMVVWAAAVVGLITTDEEPSPRYADRLSAIWTPLNRARVQGRRQLASARTSSEQAKAAAALGAAFARAAREGALLQVSSRDEAANDRVFRAITEARAAYSAMALAARRGNAAAYRRAKAAVGMAEERLVSALVALRALGYAVT